MKIKQLIIKGSDEDYTITLNPLSCTCRDFTHRKHPVGMLCKHIILCLKVVKYALKVEE